MAFELRQIRSHEWISLKNTCNKVFCFQRHFLNWIFKSKVQCLYLFISFFNFWRFKRRTTIKQSIGNNANSPCICWETITFCWLPLWSQDFRCHVIWSPTNCPSPFVDSAYHSSKTEVTNLDVQISIQKQVSKFNISVEDILWVNVGHSRDNLLQEELCLAFAEIASSLDKLRKSLIPAQLHQNVDVLVVFKVVVNRHDALVIQFLLDSDFIH